MSDPHRAPRVLCVVPDHRAAGHADPEDQGRMMLAITPAAGEAEALAALEEHTFDVVVADLQLTGGAGFRVLQRARDSQPLAMRVALSPAQSRTDALAVIGVAHQLLRKPCSPRQMEGAVIRGFTLRALLGTGRVVQLVNQLDSLPSLPSIYHAVIEELQSPTGSLARIAELIAEDIAMTAKLLQLVNTGVFPVRTQITSINQAVMLLGGDLICALVLSTKVFSQFEQRLATGPSIDELWAHSRRVGAGARALATAAGAPDAVRDVALMAGMLHDVGELALLADQPEQYARAREDARAEARLTVDLERQRLGASHAEVGAALLATWGLDDAIVEAVAFHEQPSHCGHLEPSVLTFVHIADALDHADEGLVPVEGEPEADPTRRGLDAAYLLRIGLHDDLDHWRAAIRG